MLLTLTMIGACAVVEPKAVRVPYAPPPSGEILDVKSGQSVRPAELAQALGAADIVILGEIHDNPQHHAAQAWLVAALRPGGLAFEMVPRASEEGIAVFLAQGGARGEIGPAIGWDRLGWPDWELYRPIFEAAPDAVIAGGALPRADVRRAISDGAAAVLDAPAFEPSLSTPLPGPVQAAFEAEMVEAHCGHLPAAAAPGMVQAQRLRDASFAAATVRARDLAGGDRTVLITGNGHARRSVGVPIYLADAFPDLTVLTVGMLEGKPTDLAVQPFDYVWVTAPHTRGDPCEAFKR